MTISISSSEHLHDIESLATLSNFQFDIKSAEVGDRLDVSFDEKDDALTTVLISILYPNDDFECDDEDGARSARKRWIGDDAISIAEKDALKMLKNGFGRKGMVYDGGGKWIVSKEAWTAFLVWKKIKAAEAKSKTIYRGR